MELIRPLDPRRDLYLEDHRLDGRPVLPFAMAMELMAEVAAAARPGLDFVGLRKIRLLRGIVVEGASPTLRVQGRPRAETRPGRGLALDMSIEGPGSPRKLHYRAIVDLGDRPGREETGGPPGLVGGSRLAGGAGPVPMRLEEIYREWLFHGPLFRGIVAIESIGPGGALATLRPSSPRQCLRGDAPGHWLVDPVVVDSAFQMQVIWARMHWGVTLLPAGVEEYRGYDVLRGPATGAGDGLIRYDLRIRPESQAPLCHADHYFRDHDGRLLGVLSDVEGTGTEALNRLAAGVRR